MVLEASIFLDTEKRAFKKAIKPPLYWWLLDL
jgi:hypothetical protein